MAPVLVVRSRRAQRMALKVDAMAGGLKFVLPAYTRSAEAAKFFNSSRDWAKGQLDALPPPIVFADGAVLTLFGVSRRLEHRPDRARGVEFTSDRILVGGDAEGLAKRLTDALKGLMRRRAERAAARLAGRVRRQVSAVRVFDPAFRWASCSENGTLHFSWRLAFAPPAVFRYVVAHEVAHLVHLDHGPAFWELVQRLDRSWRRHMLWLQENRTRLLRIG